MKKPTQVSNTIVAKCDDGAFRKIMLIEHIPGSNAMTKYGVLGLMYGTYSNDDDQPRFIRAA